MSDVSDQEEEPVAQVIFQEAKNLKNITVDRFPCVIDCPDGTVISPTPMFTATHREASDGSKTALFRGRPLVGSGQTDLNMFLVRPDPVAEATLKATAVVTELTNWQVDPILDDKFDNFIRVMPELLSVLHD